MLHVRTSQLIIARDVCSIQGDFFPGAWQWKTSDVMLDAMNAACEDITADHCKVQHSRRFFPRCMAMENIRCDVGCHECCM